MTIKTIYSCIRHLFIRLVSHKSIVHEYKILNNKYPPPLLLAIISNYFIT